MVGLFINTIPIRVKCEGTETFCEVMKQVHANLFASGVYSYTPLAEIQANTIPKQGLITNIVVF